MEVRCKPQARYLGFEAALQLNKLQKEGNPSPMTDERIRALQNVGFDWGKTHLTWNERLQQLREYKLQFGHCRVPKNSLPTSSLGVGFRMSAPTTGCIRKGSQVP